MKSMQEIRQMLETELMNAADHGGLSVDKLKVIDMLTHSIKSLDTIMAMQDAGYSNDRGYSNGYGHNYAYGRMYRNDGYSRTDYGREGDIKARLTEMMRNAGSEQEREALRRCIDQM